MNTYPVSTIITLKAIVSKGSAAIPLEPEYLLVMKTPIAEGFLSPPDVTFEVQQPTAIVDGHVLCILDSPAPSDIGTYEMSICLKLSAEGITNTSYGYSKMATFKFKIVEDVPPIVIGVLA